MPEQDIERPAAIAALNSLVDQLLADPITAQLPHCGNWSVRSYANDESITVIQHIASDDPQVVLDALAARLDATFTPGDTAGSGRVWHELDTTWDGVQLRLKLAAPGVSAEEQLRERVAELEAELATKVATA